MCRNNWRKSNTVSPGLLFWWIQLLVLLEWVFSIGATGFGLMLSVFSFGGNFCDWTSELIWMARYVFLDTLKFLHNVRYRNLSVWISFCTNSVVSRICSAVFEVLWKHCLSRGYCQVGCLLPRSWGHPAWNLRTPVSIICKQCLWKRAFLDNVFCFIFPFDWHGMSFQVHWASYIKCAIEIGLFGFQCGILYYLNSIQQFLWSFRGLFFAVDPVKWALCHPQTQKLQRETYELSFSSSVTIVCWRERCPTTFFLFSFWLKRFVWLDVLGFFYFRRYLNRADWPSIWCLFLDISSVRQFWCPLKATFSSLSTGLHFAHQLRAFNLKHKDCGFHQLQTAKDNIICFLYFSTS